MESTPSTQNLNIPLENPWPPTPPNESESLSSHSAYDAESEHELMVAAKCVYIPNETIYDINLAS